MSKVQNFIKTSGVYFLGNVLTKLISFFLLPLYTTILSKEDFGYYDLSISIINLIMPLAFFQIWDSVFRFMFDYDDEEDKIKVITNGFIITISGILIYSLTFTLLNVLTDVNYNLSIYMYGIMSALHYLYSTIARGWKKNTLFVFSGLVNSTCNIVLNILFLRYFKIGILGLYWSMIISMFLQIIIIEVRTKSIVNINTKLISSKLMKEMLRFSVPLGISTISYWLLSGLTRVVISVFIGMEANGLYAITNKFSSIIVLAFSVIQFGWNELSYTVAKDENKNTLYEQGADIMLRVLLLGGAISLPIIRIIFPYLIHEQYMEAINIIPATLLGVIANSYSIFLSSIFLANKSSAILSKSTMISAGINIIGIVILVPIYGLQGAVIALSIALVSNAIIRIKVLKKEGINIEWDKGIKYYIIIVITVVMFYKASLILNILCIVCICMYICYEFKDMIQLMIKETIKIFK